MNPRLTQLAGPAVQRCYERVGLLPGTAAKPLSDRKLSRQTLRGRPLAGAS